MFFFYVKCKNLLTKVSLFHQCKTISQQTISKTNIGKFLVNEEIITFENCQFDNFVLCMQTVLKSKNKYPKIRAIYLNQCTPELEIKVYKHDPIELDLYINGKKLECIDIKASFQEFLTLASPKYVGFSINHEDMNLYGMESINLINFMSAGFKPMLFMSIILTRNYMKIYHPEISIKAPLDNFYISFAKYIKKSYFNEFFTAFEEVLNNQCFVVYEIMTFESGEKEYLLTDFAKKGKKSSLFGLTIQNLMDSDFFGIISLFLFNKQKLIYVHKIDKNKEQIQNIILRYVEGFIEAKEIDVFEEKYLSFVYNNRHILASKIARQNGAKATKNIIPSKKEDLLNLYNKLGLDFIINKIIIEEKLSPEDAIKQILDEFIEYCIQSKI